jgi:hypothetical protein
VREVAAPVVEADRGGVDGGLAVRRCVERRQDKVWPWFAKACIIDVHVKQTLWGYSRSTNQLTNIIEAN